MCKKFLILGIVFFRLNFAGAQISGAQIEGTWALLAINGSDDSSLVIAYQHSGLIDSIFTNHAVNYFSNIQDSSRWNYRTEYGRYQLANEYIQEWIGTQKNLFYQFDKDSFFKENNATDSGYQVERGQFDSSFFAAFPKPPTTYRISGDSIYLFNPMQGNSVLTPFYQVSFVGPVLKLRDFAGTDWYFSRISNKPKFPFEAKLGL